MDTDKEIVCWRHALVERLDGTWDIHEVYFNADDEPVTWTKEPVTFNSESADELRELMDVIRNDIKGASYIEFEDGTLVKGTD